MIDELLAYLGPDYSYLRRSSVLARERSNGVNLQLEILRWHCLHKGLLGRDRAGICAQCDTRSWTRVYCVRSLVDVPTDLCWECGFVKSLLHSATDLVALRTDLRFLRSIKQECRWSRQATASMKLDNACQISALGQKAFKILARNAAMNELGITRKAARLSSDASEHGGVARLTGVS